MPCLSAGAAGPQGRPADHPIVVMPALKGGTSKTDRLTLPQGFVGLFWFGTLLGPEGTAVPRALRGVVVSSAPGFPPASIPQSCCPLGWWCWLVVRDGGV